jgi:hypothetical protein
LQDAPGDRDVSTVDKHTGQPSGATTVRRAGASHLEAVAHACFGEQVLRVRRIGLEFAS